MNQLHLSSGGHVFAAHCCCCSDVSGGKGHTTSTCVNYAAISQHVFLGTAVSLLVMSRERCIDVSLTSGVTSKGMLQFREKKFKPIHFDICDINDGVNKPVSGENKVPEHRLKPERWRVRHI